MLETQMALCMTPTDFLEKLFLLQTLGKWVKIGPKNHFLDFIKKRSF